MERVFYAGEDGSMHSFPSSWTNVGAEDAFVKVAAGRSAFRLEDLFSLSELLEGLSDIDRAGRGSGGVK